MAALAEKTIINFESAFSGKRLSGLWQVMKGYRLAYFGAVICVGLAALTKTATYLVLQYFIDDVLLRSDVAIAIAILYIVLSFVGLALLQGGFTFLGGTLASRTAEGTARRLRDYLYDHIQRLSFTYHDTTQTGELIQRTTSDVDAVRRFYGEQAIGIGRVLLMFGVNLAAVLNLSVRLGLVSIIIVPFIVGLSLFFFKKISKIYEDFQEQEAKLSTTLQENLMGVRVVKAFARQVYERDKFEMDNREKLRRGLRLTGMHAIFWPFSDTLCSLQMLVGLAVAALMTIDGTITLGTFVAYMGMLGWIIWPMRNLGRLIVNTSMGLVSFGRIAVVATEPREPLDAGDYVPDGALRGRIEFDAVDFSYAGDTQVLRNLSFSCEPGQAIALLGGTGSGKTSLVNLLPRFYDYTGGSITLDGVELRRYPRHVLRQNIGIVEQEPFLFSRTIRENITYGVGREVPDGEVEEAARAAAIHDVITTFPDGYNTLVGEKGVTLSGGQKQRVAIARTLLKDPRILILDDSTSSVDLETEGQIREALDNLMRNRTTFIIAHRIQSVMNADHILVLDHGEIVESGTHEELSAGAGFYSQVYEMQARAGTEFEEDHSVVH
ncbi:MAG: ABC transporter ATP-binding protein/permease [Anaerolineae bacterium]|nr:ABC transporter ATP-binding protein/permease [Anaerolineae bacterium]